MIIKTSYRFRKVLPPSGGNNLDQEPGLTVPDLGQLTCLGPSFPYL